MRRKHSILLLALCLAGLALVSLAYAQGGFDLSRWTVDGGGGTSSQGDYTLIGTAGQAEAGRAMGGGAYELAGGFWGAGREPTSDLYLYLPIVLRVSP